MASRNLKRKEQMERMRKKDERLEMVATFKLKT